MQQHSVRCNKMKKKKCIFCKPDQTVPNMDQIPKLNFKHKINICTLKFFKSAFLGFLLQFTTRIIAQVTG